MSLICTPVSGSDPGAIKSSHHPLDSTIVVNSNQWERSGSISKAKLQKEGLIVDK
uniref:Uncharacterized protein n=1 Tax=Solanum lycopersicum TaxID=4081 RepID=A0A3Q7ESY2_SOLLC